MSKGGGDTTTVQQADPWPVQQPFLQRGYQAALGNFNTPREYYPGATYVPFSGATEQGLGMLQNQGNRQYPLGGYIDRTLSQGPLAGVPGVGALGATARGDFVGQNPYLDQTFNRAARRAGQSFRDYTMPGLNATFGRGGATGTELHALAAGDAAGRFGDSMADLSASIYGPAYQQERANQLQAAGALGNLGLGGRQLQQQAAGLSPVAQQMDLRNIQAMLGAGQAIEGKAGEALQDDMRRFQFGQTEPDDALARYISAIQGNVGSATTQTQDVAGNPLAGAMGGALVGGGLGQMAGATGAAAFAPWMLGGGVLGLLSGLI